MNSVQKFLTGKLGGQAEGRREANIEIPGVLEVFCKTAHMLPTSSQALCIMHVVWSMSARVTILIMVHLVQTGMDELEGLKTH